MASKKHPLDIFRSSPSGFRSASNRRRTVQGRVVVKEMHDKRPSERRATTAAARPKPAAKPKPKQPKDGAARANRILLGTAMGTMLVLAGYLVVVAPPSGDAPVPLQKTTEILKTAGLDDLETAAAAEAAEPAAPVSEFRVIQAATYPGTPIGLDRAQAARRELVQRGFADVTVIGYPGDNDRMASYQLLVGRALTEGALAADLAALRGIDDWRFGEKRPFADAWVVADPVPPERR